MQLKQLKGRGPSNINAILTLATWGQHTPVQHPVLALGFPCKELRKSSCTESQEAGNCKAFHTYEIGLLRNIADRKDLPNLMFYRIYYFKEGEPRHRKQSNFLYTLIYSTWPGDTSDLMGYSDPKQLTSYHLQAAFPNHTNFFIPLLLMVCFTQLGT